MRSRSCALLASLLLTAGLTATAGPAGATSSSAAASVSADEPGYEIKRFHTRTDDDPQLVKAWRAWRGRDHQRYTTLVQRSCFCAEEPAIETKVRRGSVSSLTYEGRDRELTSAGYEMDALFRLLRSAHQEADLLRVSYRRGVPVSIFIDWDRRMADEELGLSVRVIDSDPQEPFAYAIKPFQPTGQDRARLRRSWQTWRAADIRSYTTTAARQAGEGDFPTLRTRVEGPVVREVEEVGAEGEPDATTSERGYEVEHLYRLLRRLHRTADRVAVRYDERGVPRFISADPDAEVVDDEFVLRTTLRAS